MTFEQILELLNDTTKTRYQAAADIHALISKATAPSALNLTPMKPRAKRGPGKAKEAKPLLSEGFVNGSGEQGEAH